MRYEVELTRPAARDLNEIRQFITASESAARAEEVLTVLQQKLATLAEMPLRGNAPKELAIFGATEFRELHHQAYRMIYAVQGPTVFIVAITDGRRDMQAFLQRRLAR
ncbi:type II toxin-antitoxin system RelE/ParE family toxin [Ancylobacter sp. WKF20]|uniref:type II toxin-antitoxin system RelE/ParE family toxin n=1 Tax=Ancylobacter sp. WKF20 TaxID=3039801 RepID=UPI00243465D6|nr:type II toxin-antitoxin system RelE/ParE family toxin [Ancylobacter sp. WKF20]WGD29215.1 type II toxin-antitoxin system RelE/ParE family toxin [Ancylobacter sp. WKF20]